MEFFHRNHCRRKCCGDSRRRTLLILPVLTAASLAQCAGAAVVAGRIAGSFDATASGAATYTLPIQVASGMNGLRPSIVLTYSSQAGDGVAGVGWTLGGFSEIVRCPLSRAVDGRVQGVRFGAQDRFCLDGRPLILLAGSYGAAGAQYRTEVHGYELVTSFGQQGAGPAWFEMRTPDGLVYRYGNDADSRMEAPGTAEVRAWALNEIEDRFQQRIGFAYDEDGGAGEYHPTEIRWTFGPSETFQQARYRLVMSWEPRPAGDVRDGFVWGSPWRSSKRLSAIDYEFNGGTGFGRVHRYSLSYLAPAAGANSHSRLASVTQCGPRDCLPATVFQWDDRGHDRSAEVITTIPVERTAFGDFNGDGATDAFGGYLGAWAVWQANPQTGGFLGPLTLGGVFGDTSTGIPLDYNGDGLTDLMVGSADTPYWMVYLAPAGPGGNIVARNTGLRWAANTDVQPMDVDGDGLDDLVYLRDGMAWLRRNTGAALAAEQAAGIGPVAAPLIAFTGGQGFVQSADFDGDGRRDLLVSRSQSSGTTFVWEAFLSIGTGFARYPVASFTTSPNRWNALLLDVNGDGLTDVLRYDGGIWQPLVSRGTPSATPGLVPSTCTSPLTEPAGNKIAALDTDGDGRSEVIIRAQSGYWNVHSSDGSCFSSVDYYETISYPGSTDYGRVIPLDSNGDGNPDIMFGSTSRQRWVLSRYVAPLRPDGVTPAPRADLIRQIADGLGNTHDLAYRPLSAWSGYTSTGVSSQQIRRLRGGPFTVLSAYAAKTGAGAGQYGVAYGYADALADTQGRGFLGFRSVRATDSRNGLLTESIYRQDFPFIGRLDRTTVWNGASKVTVYDPSWSEAATVAPDPAGDVHFVHLASDLRETYEVDADGGSAGSLVQTASRVLGWNYNHGAVQTEQTTVASPQQPGSAYRTTRSVTLDDGLRSSAGCLGHPSRIDLTRDIAGTGAQTRTVQFAWDAATCRLLARTEGPPLSPSLQLRTSFAYDGLGRTGSITLTDGAAALPQRQTRLAYGGMGFRPASESRIVAGEPDFVTTHNWYDGLGLEGSRTDPRGLTMAWGYDDFGRVIAELRPTGATVTSYTGCGACFAPGARYAIRQTRTDGYWSETQHDSFGRIVGTAFVLPDGRASRRLVEFDDLGRVRRESVPYIEGAASVFWSTYGYDLAGRIKSVDRPAGETAPSGATTSYVYAGLTTTILDAEQRRTSYAYDAEGRLTSVQPPLGGGAAYTYDSLGQLIAVLDAGWNNRQLAYDERGQLREITDPDAGRRTFTYDAFGELTSQSDSMSPPRRMTLQYDQLGRVTRRTEPEGTTTWAYLASSGPGRGQLQQVISATDASATGFQENYTYDSRGALTRTTTLIDGTSYQTDYGFDAENKLTSMTYPATVGWRPRFLFGYSNGHLTSIAEDGVALTPVYTLLAMDAQGRETAVRFGSGAVEQRESYDGASSRLSAIRAGTAADPASLQNYAYAWDRVGNLLARQDLRAAPQLQEQFSYDGLNRLTQATLNGVPTLTMTYSQDGNVLTKSDVGNYGYSTDGHLPHAVASVSGGPRGSMTFGYDANGNMTGRNGAAITWTSFNLPKQVNAGADYARFTYGPGRARIRQDVRSGAATRAVQYIGPHFEVETEGPVRRYRANVFAYGHAVYSRLETSPSGLEAYYVLHDHQGSVDRLVRAIGAGADTIAQSFDAWGRRRNTNWSADSADQRHADSHWVGRGYTGHEHLDNVRLIHMNGRLEDPMLGRMLAPDPVLGSLMNPQALNPYSYVVNDPASYFDPSGYFLNHLWNGIKQVFQDIVSFGQRLVQRWGREIVAVVAAYYTAGAASSWASAAQFGNVSVSLGNAGLLTAGEVGAAGTLTAVVPAGAIIGGMAGGAVGGAISAGDIRGAGFGALTGGVASGVAGFYGGSYSVGRVIAEGAVSGTARELRGGDFARGFLVGGGLSSLTWASLEMRKAMIEQSRLNPANASGVSDGFRGDLFKLGGCRAPCTDSPLGGVQGQQGKFFGHYYAPGSFLDHLIETYGGPHDFLNSPIFYDSLGDNIGGPALLSMVNGANVLVATPFAAASVIPSYTYWMLNDPH